MLEAVRRKIDGYDYGNPDELELLVYDRTGVSVVVKLEDGAPFLRAPVAAVPLAPSRTTPLVIVAPSRVC